MPPTYKFDDREYDFAGGIAAALSVVPRDLPALHEVRRDLLPSAQLTSETETKTLFHEAVYSHVKSEAGGTLLQTYQKFITDVIASMVKDPFLYQSFPTFRIQLPNQMAVHRWHSDSDANHGHPEWEINFQIAITDIADVQATWIESVPGLGDFRPMTMAAGEFVAFDGNRCLHGNVLNTSGRTRVSLDFRILPQSRYQPAPLPRAGITSRRRFIIGEYYALHARGSRLLQSGLLVRQSGA